MLEANPRCDTVLIMILFLLLLLAQQINQQNTPPHPPRQPSIAGIKYGPYEMNDLDLYLAQSDKPSPLVLYYFPGAFVVGNKNTVSPYLLDACAKAGITVASVNYRYSTMAPYPAPFHDAARALQFLRLHAGEYNIDPRAVASTGASAGADISLWLGFHKDLADPQSSDPVLRQSTRISAVGAASAQTTLDPRVLLKLVGLEGRNNPAIHQLYGIKREEMDDPKYFPLYEDASAAALLNKHDAVPVFLYYTGTDQPPTPDTPPGERMHHRLFGFYLKEQMDKLRVDCVMHVKEDYPSGNPGPQWNQAMVQFFVQRFPK
jgi:acetyl esterase/lipase